MLDCHLKMHQFEKNASSIYQNQFSSARLKNPHLQIKISPIYDAEKSGPRLKNASSNKESIKYRCKEQVQPGSSCRDASSNKESIKYRCKEQVQVTMKSKCSHSKANSGRAYKPSLIIEYQRILIFPYKPSSVNPRRSSAL